MDPGTRMGPYELLASVGAGGMGEVYRARDTTLGRSVAVKVLSPEASQDAELLRRFVDEAKAASALNHPNILTIHSIGEDAERPYIVSELVEGATLRTLLEAGPLSVRHALDVAIQVLAGLAKAHSAGIVHRDLKPENVMVTADGLVKILDFGVALLLPDGKLDPARSPERLTGAGRVMGTLAYMSPEQARGDAVDGCSDLFSLGIILQEMVTGSHPFRRATGPDTLAALVRDDPPPISGTEAAGELSSIVGKALRKQPAERHASAQQMEAELRSLRERLTAAGRMSGTSPAAARRLLPARALWALGVLVVATVVGIGFVMARRGGSVDSLAVLPFTSVGPDPETEYLSDGITENLIERLSRVPDLKVIARSSVFHYKGRDVDPGQVGKELGVRAVMIGRVVPRGDGVSISVELVDVRDSSHLWGEQYNRKLADVSSVQEEIAREISDKLSRRLTGEARERIARRSTDSIEAYRLYLRGRYEWNKRTDEAVKRGIEYFEQAIEKDPGYALAYAGLADAYNILGYRRYLPPKDAWLRGKSAANKALAIDESLAEAHVSLAFAAFNYDWDFETAGREFRRALELNPNYAHGRHWHSHFLTAMRRQDESLAESQKAMELDPLDGAINAHLGWHHFMARHYDVVVEQCRKVIETDPKRQVAQTRLGDAYERQGRFAEAAAAFRRSRELGPENSEPVAGLAHALAVGGRKAEARDVLAELLALSPQRYVSAFDVALVHAGLADQDAVFHWLQKAREERASGLVYLDVDPRLDGLRADSRFRELLRGVGLEH